ncbi:MAG TPA: OmpH family outer membrane protein [Bacteroidales bacterium]|nr:OmpH family outer membrane protein [Bacteroidales bacterium]
MTKKLFISLALILPLTAFAQDLKFGYFNRAEIFQSMPETVAATKKIDEIAKNYETELMKMQEEYQKKGSDFVAAKDSLPESIKVRRMTEIQDLEQRLQSFYQDSQTEIKKTQQDLIVPINAKLMTAVKAVGQDQGFIYIFDTSANAGLMYWSVDKCVDVTSAIRSKLNLK